MGPGLYNFLDIKLKINNITADLLGKNNIKSTIRDILPALKPSSKENYLKLNKYLCKNVIASVAIETNDPYIFTESEPYRNSVP